MESACSTVHTAATLSTEQEITNEGNNIIMLICGMQVCMLFCIHNHIDNSSPTYNLTDPHMTGPHTVSVSVSAADLDQEESVTPVVLSTPTTTPAHSTGMYNNVGKQYLAMQ